MSQTMAEGPIELGGSEHQRDEFSKFKCPECGHLNDLKRLDESGEMDCVSCYDTTLRVTATAFRGD